MPTELRVVARLHDESAGQLPLKVERPRVILRQTTRIVGLPVRDVAAIQRFGHEERWRRQAGQPRSQLKAELAGKAGAVTLYPP